MKGTYSVLDLPASVAQVLVLALATGVFSYLLTNLVRRYALRREILDRPNDRSSHTIPTPRGGGVGILAAGIVGIAAAEVFGLVETTHFLVIAGGMLLLGVVGWMDDRTGVQPRLRLLIQTLVSACAVYMLGGMPAVRFGVWTADFGLFGYAVAVIGLVWSINLFNFMDGIDGFAGSQAVIIFGLLAALALARGDMSIGSISAVLGLASLGFLILNWPPAKIFMGDVGSGALGFAIAALAVASENSGSVPLVAVAIVSGVFIADATVTVVRRVRRGDNLAEAHRSHAYQRLSRAWGTHRSVTVAAAGLSLGLAALAAAGAADARVLLPSLVVAAVIIAAILMMVERRAP